MAHDFWFKRLIERSLSTPIRSIAVHSSPRDSTSVMETSFWTRPSAEDQRDPAGD